MTLTATPATRTGAANPGARATASGRRQLVVFAVIGVASTVVHLGLFWLVRQAASAQVANATALVVATVANTWANRRLTFGVTGARGWWRQQGQGLLVLALSLATTSTGLAALHAATLTPPRWLELVVVASATALSTVVKFVVMKAWMFRPHPINP